MNYNRTQFSVPYLLSASVAYILQSDDNSAKLIYNFIRESH